MRVSSKADYGVRALFDLSIRFGKGPIQSRDIALRQRVSEAYLHQVLSALGRAGYVRSTRGPLGGHELIREPSEITVWDVVCNLDGLDQRAHPHVDGLPDDDTVHEVWHELQARSIVFLRGLTFADLVERHHAKAPIANYSI